MRTQILWLEEETPECLAFAGRDKFGSLRIEVSRERAAKQSSNLASDPAAQKHVARQAGRLPFHIVERKRVVRIA